MISSAFRCVPCGDSLFNLPFSIFARLSPSKSIFNFQFCAWPRVPDSGSSIRSIRSIPGVCGVVPGSIHPKYTGIEAGLSATGDIFDAIARRAGTTVAELSRGLEKVVEILQRAKIRIDGRVATGLAADSVWAARIRRSGHLPCAPAVASVAAVQPSEAPATA